MLSDDSHQTVHELKKEGSPPSTLSWLDSAIPALKPGRYLYRLDLLRAGKRYPGKEAELVILEAPRSFFVPLVSSLDVSNLKVILRGIAMQSSTLSFSVGYGL